MAIFRKLMLLLPALYVALASALPVQAQTFPELTGRVVDQAEILSPAEEAAISQKLEQLETQSGRQLVVATISTLEDYPIEDYGYRLGREWGIGSEANNDGALLLVAPNDRKVRIEIGYGLEGIVTDALSSIIIQNDILPQFRDGNLPAGINAGVDSLVTQLTLPEDEARAYAGQLEQQAREESDDGNTILVIFWLAILVFFVLPYIFSRGKGRKYRGSSGPIIIWGPGGGSWGGGSSGGSSWGSSGGFGGGGFSGGGGSFGGGGASGGW